MLGGGRGALCIARMLLGFGGIYGYVSQGACNVPAAILVACGFQSSATSYVLAAYGIRHGEFLKLCMNGASMS